MAALDASVKKPRKGEDGTRRYRRGGDCSESLLFCSSSREVGKEVVFAPTPAQLKLVEKTACKRPRNKEVMNCTKTREAWKDCRKLPGARGALLMAALDASVKKPRYAAQKEQENCVISKKEKERMGQEGTEGEEIVVKVCYFVRLLER
nr:peptidase C19, ubiquitin carboxyl-terminal hydrolase 2 [Tanacetum cinerariifolium]